MCVGDSSNKSLSVYVNKYRSLLAKVSEGTPMADLSYSYLNTILNNTKLKTGVAHAPTPPHYQVNVCATPNMISINQVYLLEEFISKNTSLHYLIFGRKS